MYHRRKLSRQEEQMMLAQEKQKMMQWRNQSNKTDTKAYAEKDCNIWDNWLK
jgi:hypothetical protein